MKNFFTKGKTHTKNAIRIYNRDMRNILTSYATLIIIIAITILPSLYAWINIKASWDPYANTKGLSVAVVNLDKGTEFKNVKINVGKDVVENLANNQSIGWKFVDSDEAKNGVQLGTYYASLTIPENFSENLLSIITQDTPTKAELIYYVNEKTNAIAPKITQKGATALQEEITKNFIQTSSNAILSYLNQFGVELENNKPELKKIADLMIDVDNKMPEIEKSIDNVYNGATTFQQYMKKVQDNSPNVSNAVNNTVDLFKTNNENIQKTGDLSKTVSPIISSSLSVVKNITDESKTLLNNAENSTSDSNSLRKTLTDIKNKYKNSIEKIDFVLNLMKSINNRFNTTAVTNSINKLSDIRTKLYKQENKINTLIKDIDTNSDSLSNDINLAKDSNDEISGLIDDIIYNFDNNTNPAIVSSMNSFIGLSNDTVKILENVQATMPLVNGMLDTAIIGTDSNVNSIKEIKDEFPTVRQNLHSNIEKLNSLNDDDKINEVIKLLKKNAKDESEFLSSPIDLKEDKIYPIPNYGSAMSPFYSTLALWVGGLILTSLLSVEVKNFDDKVKLSAREQFMGRYLTFITIGIFQALVVSLGNLFLLKTYVVSPILYVLYSVYVSIIFITIIYSSVSVLGNIGKSLIMVAMVLQVSASGGTFPIQLLGSFFQYINPILPFTYSISGMRETVAGIIPQVLINDTFILSIYFFVYVVLGMFLKEKVNKINEKFIKQFKDSGLAE